MDTSIEFGHMLVGHCLVEKGFEAGVKVGGAFHRRDGKNYCII